MAATAVVALAVAVVAPLLAPSAGATIANAGDVTVSMHLSVFTPTFTIAGLSTMGSTSATVSDKGQFTIPQSSLSFQPIDVQMNLPDAPEGGSAADSSSSSPAVVTVQAVATSAFSGGLDPTNGSAFVVGNIQLLWSQSPTMSNCPVGPFRVVARTNAQGAIPYSSDTGSVSMVDPGFTIDAIPSPTPGCAGFENAINGALSLPVTTTTTTTQPNQPPPAIDPTAGPPVPAVVVSLSFNPAPRASIPQPVQHHPPHPTTTTAKAPTVTPTTENVTPTSTATAPPPARNGVAPTRRVKHPVSKKVRHPNQHKKKPAKVKKGLRITIRRPVKTKPAVRRPLKHKLAPGIARKAAVRPKLKARKGAKQLSFVPASFVKQSPSAMATGLNLAGLLGLLVFSSLALWLVTSELSDFKAGARRQRSHRIAGVTDHR